MLVRPVGIEMVVLGEQPFHSLSGIDCGEFNGLPSGRDFGQDVGFDECLLGGEQVALRVVTDGSVS